MMKISLFVIGVCAAPPIGAQILAPHATVSPAQLKIRPQVSPIVRQATVELFDIPIDAISEFPLDDRGYPTDRIWKVTRSAPTVGPSGAIGQATRSAIYRKRIGFFPRPTGPQRTLAPKPCGTLRTIVRLTGVLDNRFYVSAARIVPVTGSGLKPTEAGTIAFEANVRPNERDVVPMRQASHISISPPIALLAMNTAAAPGTICQSEYYLHLSVTGPAGVDPYTGKPYPPGSPVN